MRHRISAAAVLLCGLLLTACTDKPSAHRYQSPAVITADGSADYLPVGNVYPLDPSDIPQKAGEAVCKAAKQPYSADTLNTVWFGENVFGAGLASVVYFGKYAADLTAEEWALLAEIAADPEQYADALSGGAAKDSRLNPHAADASRLADHPYYDAMIEEIVADITETKKCSRAEAFVLLYSDGVTIETPFSPGIQQAVDAVYSDPKSFADYGTVFPQSACAVLDYQGNVLAVAAGNNGNTAYNRAYRTLHPIGSSIKPISVYAPAVQRGIIGFSSAVEDAPTLEVGTPNAWPSNYNGVYDGEITVTYALRQSKNTVPVRLCNQLTPEVCLNYLREQLGFSTLTAADATAPAMALGQLDRGVSLTELAAAYQIFGNGGSYHAPCFYTKVTDKNGRVLASYDAEPVQALDRTDAWIMNRLLYYNICKDDGIAQAARLDDGSEVCGKTGTVDWGGSDTDRLFVGLTPEYTAAVWIGYDEAGAAIDMTDYKLPAAVWKQIMERADRQQTAFQPDPDTVTAEYCTESGLRAGPGCRHTETGYYRADAVPDVCELRHGESE